MSAEKKKKPKKCGGARDVFETFLDWEKRYFPDGVDSQSSSQTADPERYAGQLAEESLRRLMEGNT